MYFNRKYNYQRAKYEDLIIINSWFSLLKNTITKYRIVDTDIYNFDETGFMIGIISIVIVVTSSERTGRVKAKQPGNREQVTVIQAVNILGWSVLLFVVVKGKYILLSQYNKFKLLKSWRLSISDNRQTTNKIRLEQIEYFEEYTQYQKVGIYRLLILDSYESYYSTEFKIFYQEHDIITLYILPYSSHILQPLDIGCFSPLKKAYSKQIEDLMHSSQTYIIKEDFFPVFQVVFQESMTISNIQGGFRGTGIIPFDPQRVLDTLPPCTKIPTPSNSCPSTAQTWNPITPKNATDASRQSAFIKTRINYHQGSSLIQTIDTIDQFTKGSVAIMHEVALLRSRITELEEANERLSKRHKAKKTRLQKGGSLSVQEAEDLVAQTNIGNQQGDKIGSSGVQDQGV